MQKNKITIQYIKNFVKHKGECLSDNFLNLKTPLKWQCFCGNIWEVAALNVLYKNSWCPKCANETNVKKHTKYNIQFIKNLAISRNGQCLSQSFKNVNTKLIWKCNVCNYKWETTPNSIINYNSWCRRCSNKIKGEKQKKYVNVKDINKIVKKLGGKCLSLKVDGYYSSLVWQCKQGHIFKKKLRYILEGSWCPLCSKWITEKMCRVCLEQKLNLKLERARPKWLIGFNDRSLELDMYCEKEKIAFEYNGEQHYQEVKFFSSSCKLKEIQYRDNLKKELCEKNNIKLIVIPYFYVKKNLEKGIKKILLENNLCPDNFDSIDVDYSQAYSCEDVKRYNDLKEKIKSKNGILLTKVPLKYTEKYKIKCEKGHIWSSSYFKIMHNIWCPNCGGKIKKTIKEVINKGLELDLKFVDDNYKNVFFKHNWECLVCNNILNLSLNQIKSTTSRTLCNFCKCGREKKVYNKKSVKQYLKMHNLELLSDYKNIKQKIKIRCFKCEGVFENCFKNILRNKNKCNVC